MNVLSCNKISKFRPKITWKFHQNKLSSKFISHCSAWERCWMNHHFPFLIHWWFLWVIPFRLNHRMESSSNWKKSRVVVCPRMRIYRDEFLETEKKRTEWKKEVIDTFWLFSQCTELSFFLFKREAKLVFNIEK